jgi:hypothetical protein
MSKETDEYHCLVGIAKAQLFNTASTHKPEKFDSAKLLGTSLHLKNCLQPVASLVYGVAGFQGDKVREWMLKLRVEG